MLKIMTGEEGEEEGEIQKISKNVRSDFLWFFILYFF
jgi:hypothetical protein